ncbi:serine/threonine protein kinase [Streptomyces sp. A7024]|uniref:non-specific serine/threonine protein kinase n=1 Tax=Streptomyces coryli TaxID=1128680 RepID=A0A6G4TS96_9ACTN|nr:serine/threonine-protein kinase [Streptomyces coryli]NGN62865.1 serine/threonine protein kinase [Streptomyces coryli]
MSPQAAGGYRSHLIAGRYQLTEQIGRGGMGQVWRARDEVLGRIVAIKEMGGLDGDDDAGIDMRYERARREARAAARIDHPNVVRIYDVVHQDGRLWLVMELVAGATLAHMVREEGPLPVADMVHIGLGLATALREVHAAGVLHRDVKPANVMLEPGGRVVLMDFGIAVLEEPGDTTLTSTGAVIGTVGYLAPERVKGQPPGPASDLWSLGATLYHGTMGHDPFQRTSTWAVLTAVVTDSIEIDASAGPLAPLLTALLQKNPDARPPAATVIHELTALAGPHRWQAQETVRERPEPPPRDEPAASSAPTAAAPAMPRTTGTAGTLALTSRPDPAQPRSYIPRRPATAFAPRHPRSGEVEPDGRRPD